MTAKKAEAAPGLDVTVTIKAPPTLVMRAFFDGDALGAWWQAARSVTTPRVLGPYAVEWRPTDYRDEVLGRLGGVFRGTVVQFEPGRGFFVADAFWLPPDGDPIGPMALEARCSPQVAGTLLHLRQSGHDETNERYLPHVVEPAAGVDRMLLAFLLDAYHEEPDKDETRVVLRLHPRLAPYKVAVLPLSRKLAPKGRELWGTLRKHWMTGYDDSQSIGRRYRRQDEIGTPWAFTIDQQTLEDGTVTIRDRDTLAQERVPLDGVRRLLREKLDAPWSPRAD